MKAFMLPPIVSDATRILVDKFFDSAKNDFDLWEYLFCTIKLKVTGCPPRKSDTEMQR